MAIWVKIRKLFEQNEVGYYKVYSQDYETIEFYMAVNRPLQLLEFYFTEDFSKPVKIIDSTDEETPMGPLVGANVINYMKAIGKGLKVLKMNEFPESLDFAA